MAGAIDRHPHSSKVDCARVLQPSRETQPEEAHTDSGQQGLSPGFLKKKTWFQQGKKVKQGLYEQQAS